MIAWTIATFSGAALAFVVGGIWYGALFGTAAASLNPAFANAYTSAAEVGFEVLRCLALAVALTVLLRWTGTTTAGGALLLGLVAWAGFQAAGLAGAVVHEGYPLRLYLIHTGDALAKALVVSSAILALARWWA